MIIDTLLRAVYDKDFYHLDEFIVTIKDRFNGWSEIDGNNIRSVTKESMILRDGTEIPSHRIIKVEKKKK